MAWLKTKSSSIRTAIMEAVNTKIDEAEALYEQRCTQAQESYNRAVDVAEKEAIDSVLNKLR